MKTTEPPANADRLTAAVIAVREHDLMDAEIQAKLSPLIESRSQNRQRRARACQHRDDEIRESLKDRRTSYAWLSEITGLSKSALTKIVRAGHARKEQPELPYAASPADTPPGTTDAPPTD